MYKIKIKHTPAILPFEKTQVARFLQEAVKEQWALSLDESSLCT